MQRKCSHLHLLCSFTSEVPLAVFSCPTETHNKSKASPSPLFWNALKRTLQRFSISFLSGACAAYGQRSRQTPNLVTQKCTNNRRQLAPASAKSPIGFYYKCLKRFVSFILKAKGSTLEFSRITALQDRIQPAFNRSSLLSLPLVYRLIIKTSQCAWLITALGFNSIFHLLWLSIKWSIEWTTVNQVDTWTSTEVNICLITILSKPSTAPPAV